ILIVFALFFFFQAEDGIRDFHVTGVQTCALPILLSIENLASFHEAAALRGDAPVLLLYTGGMPSPTWRAAYARLLAGLPATAARSEERRVGKECRARGSRCR